MTGYIDQVNERYFFITGDDGNRYFGAYSFVRQKKDRKAIRVYTRISFDPVASNRGVTAAHNIVVEK